MADRLYLSLWFPSFTGPEMMPRALSVLRQFPFSEARAGIGAMSVHPVGWDEPVIFQQTFDERTAPDQALALAEESLHSDYAYKFEAAWDLWTPGDGATYDQWLLRPQAVDFYVHGEEFDDASYQQNGHVQVDFGLDTPFLFEDVELTALGEQRIKENVQKLVAFTAAVEKHCGLRGRVLWSDSEENLAQKLIARLQRVQ
jgi:hypothetical protein